MAPRKTGTAAAAAGAHSAAAAPLASNYKNLVPAFAFYAAYHDNIVNQVIHIICVPLILITALVFLSYADMSGVVPDAVAKAVARGTGEPLNAALVVAAAYMLYYLYLTPSALGCIALGMVGLCFTTAVYAKGHLGAAAWQPALAVHVVAWIAQFYGHGVHEGRSPALLDNLFQVSPAAALGAPRSRTAGGATAS